MRPLHAYSDVKIVMAESELFSLHLADLIARPQDFGQDFRARALAACLFTAEDYVRASRERRTIMGEMRELYRRYDLFLTANSSAAPRLDKHDVLSFWKQPNLTSPFNCTGGPALAVLCGFTQAGLPLSMQIAGRPFDDARVLAAGHAYEQASGWSKKHPRLTPGASPGAVDPKPWVPDTSNVEPAVRARTEAAARCCGLASSRHDHGGAGCGGAMGAGHGRAAEARPWPRGRGVVDLRSRPRHRLVSRSRSSSDFAATVERASRSKGH